MHQSSTVRGWPPKVRMSTIDVSMLPTASEAPPSSRATSAKAAS